MFLLSHLAILVDTAARSLVAHRNDHIKNNIGLFVFRETEWVRSVIVKLTNFEIEIEMTEYGSIFAIEFAF